MTRQRSAWTEMPSSYASALSRALDVEVRGFWRNVHDGQLRALVADEPGIGWHLSISHAKPNGEPGRYPSWDEIAHARSELLPADVEFVMHLPTEDRYVAVHDTTFHLHEHHDPTPAPVPRVGASLGYLLDDNGEVIDPLSDHQWPGEAKLAPGAHLYAHSCAWCRFSDRPDARDAVVAYLTGGAS